MLVSLGQTDPACADHESEGAKHDHLSGVKNMRYPDGLRWNAKNK